MHVNVQAQPLGELHRLIRAVVVHQDADIHQVRKLSHGGFQSLFGIKGGHNHRHAHTVDHEFQRVWERELNSGCVYIIVTANSGAAF